MDSAIADSQDTTVLRGTAVKRIAIGRRASRWIDDNDPPVALTGRKSGSDIQLERRLLR